MVTQKANNRERAMPAQGGRTGPWDDSALAKLREFDASWAEQCVTMSTNPWTSGVLSRKTVELVGITANAASRTSILRGHLVGPGYLAR
jgi:hypothetical protein